MVIMKSPKPAWQASASSAELAAGYRAARVLQSLTLPSPLAKQVANYICRMDVELAVRGISADKLTADAEPTRERR
jgi:hypothetical protein